jgi:CubicO group peptidase (beta-lactamase class C family)
MVFMNRLRMPGLGALALAGVMISAAPPATQPQATPSPEIAVALEAIIKAHNIPGMVAAIVEGDGSLEIGCAGVRQQGEPQAITIFDRMHLGSCTKSMTATMIATLVQDGTLSFETTIGEVFSDVPAIKGTMDPAWKDVSLTLLLCNRSGAPGNLDMNNLWRDLWRHEGSGASARIKLVEAVLSAPPEAPPNTRYIYSNAGFSIAGAMAENVTGESWEDLMTERIFEPLKMNSAGFGAPGSAKAIDQPRGHKADGTPIVPGKGADNPVAIGPAGIVHCNLIDWCRYIALHIRGGQGHDTVILKAEMFRILHTPAKKTPGEQSPDYAMGWSVTRRAWGGEGVVLTHNGTNIMWYAVTWIAPEKDFAVLVACNKGGDEAAKACDQAAAAMIKRHAERLQWP